MRIPFEYITLAISSLGYSSSGVASVEDASCGTVTDASRCWAPSVVVANYAHLSVLRTDAKLFCDQFSTNNTAIVAGSGKYAFYYESAMSVGNFASWTSCMNTFNAILTHCYGTADPIYPVSLGGSNIDPGGAHLVVSFCAGVTL